MTGDPLELFRKFFGAVRAICWLWGSFFGASARKPQLLVIFDCKEIVHLGAPKKSRDFAGNGTIARRSNRTQRAQILKKIRI